MVEVTFTEMTQCGYITLKITHDEKWHCVVNYRQKDVPVLVTKNVIKTLTGNALNSFFINEIVEPGSDGIPPLSEEPYYEIEIQAEDRKRNVCGSSSELAHFCQIEPLSKFANAVCGKINNDNYREEFIQSCFWGAQFTNAGKSLDSTATLLNFWHYQFSNIWNMTGELAEYIVAHALGIDKASNRDNWSLWDIKYKNARIEVKSTADYHCWTSPQDKPTPRVFSIRATHTRYKDVSTEKKRQSDIYVFCYNKGNSPIESHPLEMNHWDFYVIKTKDIDEKYKNQKTISLGSVKKLAKGKCLTYLELRIAIDAIIPTINQLKQSQSMEL